MLVLTLIILLLSPQPAQAYFRLQAQTVPYLVVPKTRVELRASSSSSAPSALQEFSKNVLDLVNRERKKKGLPALKSNPLLERSAQAHADNMVKQKFFSHESPDRAKPEDRIRAAGYFVKPCNCAVTFSYGENIAKGQKTAKDVMTAWMNSKIHRDNILKREFTDLGVGFAGGLWVQNFGGIAVERK
ncbi:MAG: hypothetical protein HOO67_02270 [Candidatus Peribacteraceae bacterium]|nr:hypothetical protein [Candidatus Peribacteraceae bacterium]